MNAAPSLNKASIFGYPVHLVSLAEALREVMRVAQSGSTCQVVTLNPEMIMQAEQNSNLSRILKSANLALPDGAGLVWALRYRGLSVNRLPGIEFSEALLSQAAQTDKTLALIGATPETLELAQANLLNRFPGLRIVYSQHGFFQPGDEAEIASVCAALKPDVVLVALGVPRQELWIERYKDLFRGTILVGVGGSLDVWSGLTKRAPAWMRRLNLEWFYRISSQPFGKQGRLKRTYKVLPLFALRVLFSKKA